MMSRDLYFAMSVMFPIIFIVLTQNSIVFLEDLGNANGKFGLKFNLFILFMKSTNTIFKGVFNA